MALTAIQKAALTGIVISLYAVKVEHDAKTAEETDMCVNGVFTLVVALIGFGTVVVVCCVCAVETGVRVMVCCVWMLC